MVVDIVMNNKDNGFVISICDFSVCFVSTITIQRNVKKEV